MIDLHVLVALLGFLLVVQAVGLIGLWYRYRCLRTLVERLQRQHQGQQRDIIGLCEAAVRMDRRLEKLAHGLEEIREWAQDLQHQDLAEEPSYQAAIERIHQGADVEELVSECGFTREEASLLIRLYRSEKDGSYPEL